MTRRAACVLMLFGTAIIGGCGKKGDPLPPLVRRPSAPADVVVERRASTVDVRFTIPATNSDGTRPADIERIDVYAVNDPAAAAAEDLIRRGTRIGSVAVKSPKNPNDTIRPGDSDADLEPLTGSGLDQGAAGRVSENLASILGTTGLSASSARSYVVVGISTKGRRGLLSKSVAVPLTEAPPSPGSPLVSYDATTVTVEWPIVSRGAPGGLGVPFGYNVYDVSPSADRKEPQTRVTTAPLTEPKFLDSRIEWGVERCYEITTVETRDGLSVESDSSGRTCVRLTDTFPPAVPQGLVGVQSEGAVNLSWDPSDASDLAGYIVLRGEAVPGAALTRLTPAPIQETTFRDTPPPGVRYSYAVQAVDRNGNQSAPSARVEASAR